MKLGSPLTFLNGNTSMVDAGGAGSGVGSGSSSSSGSGHSSSLGTGTGTGTGTGNSSLGVATGVDGTAPGTVDGNGNDSGSNSTGAGRHTPGYQYWQREYEKCCLVRRAGDMKKVGGYLPRDISSHTSSHTFTYSHNPPAY